MDDINTLLGTISDLVWGPQMLILLGLTGLFLSIGLKFYTLTHLGKGFSLLWQGRRSDEEGDISPFNALMTSLSATIGTGNIAGVATAIAMGGPGAIFWMWAIALLGMATKYAEAVLAVEYREIDEKGDHVGGPMYYIKNGLGPKWHWMGVCFAVFGMLAGFGLGNTVQSNSVASVMGDYGLPNWGTGLILSTLVGLVLIGGIQRIAQVVGKLIPLMALSYIVACITVIISYADMIPATFLLIFEYAFTPISAVGGFAGATVAAAIRMGIARGLFSNEAGLGSAPIAHAAAKTDNPVRQGTIAMLGTFIDTLIVCTMTALVIITTGAWESGINGAPLSVLAFETALPGFGSLLISLGLMVFAFTTMIGWSFYGEKCTEFLFGIKAIFYFRVLWVIAIFVGAIVSLELVWKLADILNALMALPNLAALLLLSPVVFKLTKTYVSKERSVGHSK